MAQLRLPDGDGSKPQRRGGHRGCVRRAALWTGEPLMATVRKGRQAADPDAVARLHSTTVDNWMTPAERAEVARLVREAVRSGDFDEVARLAPSARWRMLGEHRKALAGVERAIVKYRRQRAGAELALATGQDPGEVARVFDLGFCSARDRGVAPEWTAAGPIA
jgi:hypothetical protein